MTFLQPFLLFMSFLVIIPILIHLLGERNYKPYLFPDLRFLKELKSDAMQNIKLRQWLILLLRLLWMLCLILALAQPYISGKTLFSTAVAPGVILYDNSFSTKLSANYEDNIDLLSQNFPDWKILEYDERIKNINHLIDSTEFFFDENHIARPHIIWISDCQANSQNNIIHKFLQSKLENSDIFILKNELNEDNAAISALSLTRDFSSGIDRYKISLQMSTDSSTQGFYSAYFSIENKSQSQITLNSDGYGDYFFPIPSNNEWLEASVHIEGDIYEKDNFRYFVIPPDTPRKILLLRSENQPSYLSAGLQSISGFTPDIFSPAALSTLTLENYDLIIYEANESASQLQQERLLKYSKNNPLLYIPWSSDENKLNFKQLTGKITKNSHQNNSNQFQTIASIQKDYSYPGFHENTIQILNFFLLNQTNRESIWKLSSGQDLLLRFPETEFYVLLSPFSFNSNLLGMHPDFMTTLKALFNTMLGTKQHNYFVGDTLFSHHKGLMTVNRPDGISEKADKVYINADIPGIYRIKESDRCKAFALNVDREECLQKKLLLRSGSLKIFSMISQDTLDSINKDLRGREAASLLIYLAAIFFLMEMLLLTFNRKGLI